MNVRFPAAFLFSLPVFVLVAVGLIAPAPLASQSASEFAHPITGVLRPDRGGSLTGYRVELSNAGGWGAMWTDVRPDGSFRISVQEPAERQYLLRVIDGHGQVVHDAIVRPDATDLEIHLHGQKQERPVNGVVSLEELRNSVPRKAMKQYQRSLKAMRKPDLQQAIRHLFKAIEIHPEFVEAHNSLGVKYMMLRDYPKAAAAFEEALRLRPEAVEPLCNLGIAYHGLGRYEEAESLIRAALHHRPDAAKTRFSLALVLLSAGKQQFEAVEILTSVADEIPQAHLCLATAFERQAKHRAAALEVEAYLSTDDQQFREMAQQWLKKLQRGASGPETAGVDPRSLPDKP
jgi:Tfp pilus assembly protein PilF